MAWKTLTLFSLAAALCAQTFKPHAIAEGLKGGYQVVAADLNHDGKTDLIVLASGMDELVWFEAPEWKRHVLATNMKRMINLAVHGDEIVVASGFSMTPKDSTGLVQVLKAGADLTQPWVAKEIDQLPTSHRIRFINGLFVNAPLAAATAKPPDYEGNVPLVAYKQGEWKRITIGEENRGVMHGLYITDWNGDGREDILTSAFNGIHAYLAGPKDTWRHESITTENASDVAVGKLGKKKFLCAIEPWHGNKVVVYDKGKRTVIDETIADGHNINVADFDGDGRDEIVAGYRGGKKGVNLYRWSKTGWQKEVIDEGGMAAAGCVLTDLNGDRKVDIACIGSAGGNLKWYENSGDLRRGR